MRKGGSLRTATLMGMVALDALACGLDALLIGDRLLKPGRNG